ncbi:UDP-2,4-diacetamido-2,4,6-trideoxy-beta-L-altropyranose hydrolase [Shinella sp. H4-D48]|uniref:UDP-2,4-diacetamido-2,4, 6-trideoxy-beta-L-altropyranose hydrolase n=1 Tax=Shinella sp. H4-D48 TaxID=2925841 RepID=UPI001F52FC34|nr:UDP-2,4-diacetamido-2,4,6-trideoxy-beta-L-altropyranose hydrolase [Shinella sp. H4-D48]UNK39874.1 UDP-2,4-diacetamido-2,4,6-trideoxy-beta-L-altropyranose hydrolase [Shinella sp. H4-D48]
MRCLTLARRLRLRGATVVFLMRPLSGNLMARVREDGFSVVEIGQLQGSANLTEKDDAELCIDAIQRGSALKERPGASNTWVIVDHYSLGQAWEQRIRSVAPRILAIDDLANRVHDADVLLDQNLVANYQDRYKGLVPADCVTLLGPAYALIADRYSSLRKEVTRVGKTIRSILVYFGGADKEMTLMTAEALSRLSSDFAARVILDQANLQFDQVEVVCAADRRLVLSGQLPDLAQAMADADLFVGASGTTSWERLALGLPAAVVTLADNQELLSRELERRGFITWLGRSETITLDSLVRGLRQSLAAPLDPAASGRMMSLVDALGAERVADILMHVGGEGLELRLARSSDSDVILGWANDPVTRRNAFNPRPISVREHQAWYQRRLSSPDVVFLLAETRSCIPVGQVRFERQPDQSWEVSYLVAPLFRGRQIARPMLDMAIRWLRSDPARELISGYVKPINRASIKVFEGLGFQPSAQQDHSEAIRYELPLRGGS